MDIIETITESTALLIYLLDLEKNKKFSKPVLRDSKELDKIRNNYLKPLIRTVGVGMKNLDAQLEKNPEFEDAYKVKKSSLELLRDRIATANTRIDAAYADIQKKE